MGPAPRVWERLHAPVLGCQLSGHDLAAADWAAGAVSRRQKGSDFVRREVCRPPAVEAQRHLRKDCAAPWEIRQLPLRQDVDLAVALAMQMDGLVLHCHLHHGVAESCQIALPWRSKYLASGQ